MTGAARDIAARCPTAVFFVLAFAFTWMLLPIARNSVAVAVLALFGPAAAAGITAALAGRDERSGLRARVLRWRVPWYWYPIALLSPLAISALAAWLEYLAGATGPVHPFPVTALGLTVFVMVVGEEIGWRGHALPHLLERFGPWSASIILGSLWALWHFPLFYLESMPQYGSPFVPYAAYTIALSILLTFLAQHTGSSVVIATLFHGAVNTFGLTNASATSEQRGWGNAVAYVLAALLVGALAWNRSIIARRPVDRSIGT